jgi:hypothetical protein
MQESEKGSGGSQGGPGALPLLPPLGAMKIRQRSVAGKYPPTNLRSAARTSRALLLGFSEVLTPLSFPFDHPPQSLSAGRATEPLARAATGAYEPLFASRTFAAKKLDIAGWALTLANWCWTCARQFRLRRWLGFGPSPTFCAPASIPPALSLAFQPAMSGLSIMAAGSPAPPSPSGRLTLRATVSSLGVRRSKRLLAPFE